MEQLLLGEILLNFRLVNKPDLERCLELQQRLDPQPPLGTILVQQGLIDERVLANVLSVQKDELGFGLFDSGKSRQDVARSLEKASIDDFLNAARKLGATDLFLSSGRRPAVRRNGLISDLPSGVLAFERCRDLLFALLTPEQIATYQRDKQVDVRVKTGRGRFRLNVFRHFDGIAGAFRVLADEVPTFESLGLPDALREIADMKNGLVLVTGATGSGKTSTLSAIIGLINKSRKLHVVTLEDPIEHIFKSELSLVSQRELASTGPSHADALRAVLREDPDVIVVGELRDPQTVSTALTAAETGHLVLGTLHTRGAAQTIDRIVDAHPSENHAQVRHSLAENLKAVVCQELVRCADGRGRRAAHEVLVVNVAVQQLIREGKSFQIPGAITTGKRQGMQLMDQSLLSLVRAGEIDPDEAFLKAEDKWGFAPFLTRPELLAMVNGEFRAAS